MQTLKAIVRKDESSTAKPTEENEQPATEKPKVAMRDFQKALTKVLPSVSKRDEILYRSLEGSLRKTRSSITNHAQGATSNNEKGADLGPRKPTPMKY